MKENDNEINEVKAFFCGFFVACSMYSKIPMPQFPWSDKNMKYAICHFPIIGVLIGIVFWIWYTCCLYVFQIPDITKICIGVMIPVVMTGGIHVDGFMDTSDALHSYQPRERKLEILKDSHVGAFSIIMLFLYSITGIGLVALIQEPDQIWMMAVSFVMSRCLSGISVVTFPNAKKEGTLFAFSSTAHRKFVRAILILELVICMIGMMLIHFTTGAIACLVAVLWFYGYYKKSIKEFGGITGDLAGWFLCICEWLLCLCIGIIR